MAAVVAGVASVLSVVSPGPAGANVTGIAVSASGSGCSDASTPSGYDDAYACTLIRGSSLRLVGSANSNRRELSLSWSRTGGVSVSQSQGKLQVSVLGAHVMWHRSNTATVRCTSSGAATLTAKDRYDTDRIRVSVTCEEPPSVRIAGWGGDTRDGPGRMSDGFTVSPSSASCAARRTSGISAAVSVTDRFGSTRAVSVTTTGTGTVRVQVRCTATGHTAATATAAFTASKQPVTISGFAGRTVNGPGKMTDTITVSPSSASCTAARTSGISATVSISGAGLSSRTVSVTTTGAGAVTVRVTCSRSNYTTATDSADFTSREQRVSISAFSGASRNGPGVMNDHFSVLPSDADCTASRVSGISARLDFADDTSASRTLSVDTRAATGSITVRVRCTATGHTAATDTATFTARRVPVDVIGFGNGSRNGPGVMTDRFSVDPDDADCTASRVSGIAATFRFTDDDGASRVLEVTTTGTGAVTVRITCAATGYTAGSDTATFTAREQRVSISGFGGASRGGPGVMADYFSVSPSSADCTASRTRGIAADLDFTDDSSTSRTLSVDTGATTGTLTVRVTCTATGYTAATGTATFTARRVPVDIIGFGNDSRNGPGAMTDRFSVDPDDADCTAARVSGITADLDFTDDDGASRVLEVTTTGTGTVTVRITCTAAGYAAATATAVFTARPGVQISGFSGASRYGAGQMSAAFAVTPANASCTATRVSGVSAAATVSPRTGADRTVAVTAAGTGTAQVRLRCTASGLAPGEQTESFTARAVNLTVGARATSGGQCTADATPPAGTDAAWDCWTGSDRSLTVVVTATASLSDVSVGWPTASRTGGVSLTATQGAALFNEITGRYQRSSTATITCTAEGTARAVTSVGGTAAHTAGFTVDCRLPLPISGFDGSTGATAVLSDRFTVPAAANCTATHISGIAASVAFSDDSGASRTVTVTVAGTATGTVAVRVSCAASGYAPTAVTAQFTRTGACSESLGSLGNGTVTRSGTLAAGCVSWKKGNSQTPHFARRYTLSVPAVSTVDIGVSSAAVDVFVYALTGSGATARVIASDDDSGTGTDAAVSDVQLAAGVTYTVEVTTSAANAAGAYTATLTVTPTKQPVKISGLDDSYGIGQTQATASGGFTVEPADASCMVSPTDAKITAGKGADRTVSLTRKPPFSQQATVKCTATGRSEGTAKATLRGHQAIAGLTVTATGCKTAAAGASTDYECTVPHGSALTVTGAAQGPHSGLSLSWAATGDAKIDSQTQANTQTAAPGLIPVVYSRTGTAAVSCTADGTVTLTAAAGAHSRSVTVAVACGQPPPAAACDDPLGALAEGTVTRSGTIAADSKCTTANRGRSGTYYTRRHTLTLSGPAQVTIDVGNDPANTARLDTYMVLLDGHGTTGDVNASDDDGGPGTDSRIAKKLPPGDYTVEAATYRSAATGRYRLKVSTVYDRTVKITGLADAASDGTGEVAVTAPFAVEPADAACTASPATASVADGTDAADRILTAGITAPGSLAVTVTCTAAGHAAAKQTVTLTASLAAGVTTIGARAVDGGECKTLTSAPDGADVAYECIMAQGFSFDVEAEATATGTALTVAWTATGGITVDSQSQGTVTAVPGPDSTTLHRRTATATLSCTTNGTATATAVLGDSTKTARLTVACQAPVEITGLADSDQTGSGKVAVTADFTVEPADARCGASPGTATVTAGQSAAERTLTAKIAAPGSLAVTVTCDADGRAAASQTVTLTAAEKPVSPCVSALGVLEPGAVSVTGQTSADGGCLSAKRGPVRGRRYFAHRHTFTLQEPTWVTVELVGGKRTKGNGSFDTYLRLIDGHSTDGAGRVRASSDDIGDENGSYRRDSRIEAGRLPAGKYTLEASASAHDDTGAYRLDISAVTVHGLSSALHAPHGKTTEFVFEYRPADAEVTMAGDVGAHVTVSAAAGSGVLKVTPDRPGSYLATVAITPKTPTTTQPDSVSAAADAQADDAQADGPAAAPTVRVVPAGKACAAGQTVIIIGRAVCAGPAAGQVTIRTPATGSQPAKVMPAACITRLSVGRWYLDTEAWPASTDCNAAVNNVKDSIRRRTRFYTFEITRSSVDVTIRLSSDNRNTHLALYRAITDPLSGLLTNLGSAPVAINNDAWDTAAGTGYLYLDGNATDSRIRTTLTKGVYVISAASLSVPDAADQHTINIKIPHPPSADDD